MFTSIIKELLGTKIAEIYIEILPTLIDDEYENCNYSFSERNRNHPWYYQTRHIATHLSATK